MKKLIIYFFFAHFTYTINAQSIKLDPLFGNNGIVTFNSNFLDLTGSLGEQSSGKIILSANYEGNKFSVLRYNLNGALDGSFGQGGKVSVGFEDLGITGGYLISKTLIQKDNKIIVTGSVGWNDQSYDGSDFGIIRLTQNGTLDKSFGNSGKVVTDIANSESDFTFDATLLTDESILLAGSHKWFQSSNNKPDFAIIKYKPDGSMDSSFNQNGKEIYINNSASGAITSIHATNTKILAGGLLQNNQYTYTGLIQINNNGMVDNLFANGGWFETIDESPKLLVVNPTIQTQSDGKIIIGGYISKEGIDTDYYLGAMRLNEEGILDISFGNNGINYFLTKAISKNLSSSLPKTPMVIQPDNKIIITYLNNDLITLVRLTQEGELDTNFNGTGEFSFTFVEEIEPQYLSDIMWHKKDNDVVFTTNLLKNGQIDIGIAKIDMGSLVATKNTLGIIEDVKIYPNPTSDYLRINLNSQTNESLNCQILDLNGVYILKNLKLDILEGRNEIEIPLKFEQKGLLVLKLISNDSIYNLKFIKQ